MRSRRSALAACIVAMLLVNASNAAPQDTEDWVLPAVRDGLLAVPLPPLARAEKAVAAQIEGLVQAVREAVGAREGLAAAYGALAQVFHAYEFMDAAAAAYENARRLAPRDARWAHLLGALREQTGAFDAAVDLYQQALRLEPGAHVAQLRLANVYLQLDRRGEARTQFEAQRARFPASALTGLGEVALRERRFADAIRLLEDALRRAPHATSLHYSIGMAYRGLGRLDEARAHLGKTGQGRVRPADPLVDALPALLRGYRAPLNQARIELEAGALDAAAAMFRRAVDAAPDSMEEEPTIELALRLADSELFDDALALLQTAHARFPGRDATATTLARLLAASPDRSLRNGPRALEIAAKVYDRSPTAAHAETIALALAEMSRCEEARGWMAKAIDAARREGDTAEIPRLEQEARRYERTPCL